MIANTSSRHCPCIIAQEDTWEHIMSYCIPYELCMIARTARFLRKLADKSESWYYLCQCLWKNKQYHPLERWVRLKPLVDLQIRRRTIADRIKEEESIIQVLTEKINGYEKQKEAVLGDIQLLAEEGMNGDHSRYSAKNEMLNMVEGQLSACSNFRKIVVAKIDSMRKSLDEDSEEASSVKSALRERLACPISRAVRSEWIRLECEYFSALESRDVAEAKLSALSSTSSSAGGYNKIISNQIVFDTLLNQVTQLQQKADTLKQQINRNLTRKVNMSVELASAAANGTLLSWKESYTASLLDSKRTTITPEELREMGECVAFLKGHTTLQTIRFLRGGHCITDNNSFKNSMGWFETTNAVFYLPQLSSTGSVTRVESDWGWEFSCYKGINKIASFDRSKGFDQHEGVLSHSKDGSRFSAPQELSGGLLSASNHPVGLYTIDNV